jgi:hypothetical protein
MIKNTIFDRVIDFFISADINKYLAAKRIWLAVLLISGIVAWNSFLFCPDSTCTYRDWSEIVFPRLSFLKDAAEKGVLPLHGADYFSLGDFYSYQYMAIPDAFISPQFYLLRFMDIRQFVVFQVVLCYILGFLGLLWLRRNLNLSILNFTIVFALFNFNGHILAHLSAGHLTWVVYFIFPWFAVQFYRLIDGQANWKWIVETSSLFFFILLQGGYHPFIWMLFFIGFLALVIPRHFFTLLKTVFFSILLGMIHFLPILSILPTISGNQFVAGFPNSGSIVESLITITTGGEINQTFNNLTNVLGPWEITFYIGGIGAAFMIYFGLIYPLAHPDSNNPYRILILPSLGLLLLSFDQVYRLILSIIPLPFFVGERVVTRFASLVFIFLLFQAAIEFQSWLNASSTSKFSVFLVIIFSILGLNDLILNFRLWDIKHTTLFFPHQEIFVSRWFVANDYHDSVYINLIILGATISLLTYIFLFWMLYREKKRQNFNDY